MNPYSTFYVLFPALPLVFAFLLDAAAGDPSFVPHPVRLMGHAIGAMENIIRGHFKGNLKKGGFLLAAIIPAASALSAFIITAAAYHLHIFAGIAAESVLCCYMIAAGDLKKETMEVYRALEKGDISLSRKKLSMVVGRDTAHLCTDGIIRADVETIAENTSDGVTAPLIYMALCGAAGGFFYKAVNTLDSMVGYENERFAELGFASAKLDDILNFVPSRLTALCMVLSAGLTGLDMAGAFKIWKRDRLKHKSPNSAQCESACAGALGIRLGGDAWYFGKLVKKEYIGDRRREPDIGDIVLANRLMSVTSFIMWILCVLLRITLIWMLF